MNIRTCQGNHYSYLRRTNEIVGGIVDDNDYIWHFDSLSPFSAMADIEMFIIGITEQCNLRCTYCCYSGAYTNNRIHGSRALTFKEINDIYDFIQSVIKKRHFRIAFYGGEPLLQYPLIQYAILKGKERWNSDVEFAMSTNGTLLTNDKIDWFVNNNVELAISIDGPGPFHDKHRIDTHGIGSYAGLHNALTYIKENHLEYLSSVVLQMTLASYNDIVQIAEEWSKDEVLKYYSPSNIHGLSPNFNKGVKKVDFEETKQLYTHILDEYEKHQGWSVLKIFLDECISYWNNRPIVDAGQSVPMATCIPHNTKLYIDSNKQIGVCEKVADKYRIGNVYDGIDWERANGIVKEYYQRRVERCKYCPAVRMCDMCLTAIEYTDEQWDVLCHNEQVYAQIFMFLYCEMAERGLLT